MTSSSEQVAVQPRPASTAVLLRAALRGSVPELFMLRRSAQSPFMPSTHVFPGGRVDAGDGETNGPEAFLRACRRECNEEAGIDLGARPLTWFDTWTTPSAEPRRYYARFYHAIVTREESDVLRADGHETHDGEFATASVFLERWRSGNIDLPPPTLCVLLRLQHATLDAFAGEGPHDVAASILPKWIRVDQRDVVLLPHDRDYDAAPGEGSPAPARVRGLPTRFFREGTRWLPTS